MPRIQSRSWDLTSQPMKCCKIGQRKVRSRRRSMWAVGACRARCMAWLQASRRWPSQQMRAWTVLIEKLGYGTGAFRRARAQLRKFA